MAKNDYSTFVAKNKMYPIVKDNLNESSKKFIYYIQRYIDKNHDILFSKNLNQLYWNRGNGEDSEIIYKSIGCDEDFINNIINESGQTNNNWKTYNKPWNWALVNIIKYYFDNKQEKELSLALLYLSFSMYATLFYKYFRFAPNENIMDYTVNNLSNRYDLKKLGSLIKVLQKVSMGCHDKYKEYLLDKNFCDRYIIEYVMNLNTRLNNFIQEIKKEYEKNRQSGNYINYDENSTDVENFHENDNLSYQIQNLSNKVTNKILTTGVNLEVCNKSANIAGVSMTEVKNAVEKIIDKETEEIREMNTIILQQYLIVDNHPIESISSKNYIVYLNKIYTKSNTNDKGIIRMKELLDKWLNENCEKYRRTERQATIISYRKSIFLYFGLSIQAVLTKNY
jgi:hypothetical protein